jgi:hypothetical protein
MKSKVRKQIVASVRKCVDEVVSAVESESPATESRGGAKGKSKSKTAPKSAAKASAGPKPKRTPDELAAVQREFTDYVRANPGKSIEEVGRALGRPTSELTLPVKKLIQDKTIKTQGEKRATRYFPGKAG